MFSSLYFKERAVERAENALMKSLEGLTAEETAEYHRETDAFLRQMNSIQERAEARRAEAEKGTS